jgi:uncharacterized repeat protein (TIGR03803 family)
MNPATPKIKPQRLISLRKTVARDSLAKLLRVVMPILILILFGWLHGAAAQTLTTLHSFAGSPSDGASPEAGLVQGSDGNFYGTTADGGTDDHGTVFRITPAGTLIILYNFTGAGDGGDPEATLVEGSDGNFYGTTGGGTNTSCNGGFGCGTVFKITPTRVLTTLYRFTQDADGANPEAGLVQGSDGNFYGTTADGGTDDHGTVFRITSAGALATLYNFTGSADGGDPEATLVEGSDGNFYGTTDGGTNTSCNGGFGCGTVFKITPAGVLTTLYRFTERVDGANPEAGLVQGSDSNFYGTTAFGGTDDQGTVFKITPAGVLTTLYSFTGGADGGTPKAGLANGNDGNFYGATSQAGINNGGTAFRISPAGGLTTLYSFAGNGSFFLIAKGSPQALVQGNDGNFYGTSSGFEMDGTVFKLDVGIGPCFDASIGPTNAVFDTSGGSNSVSVTASNDCSWTAVSHDPSFIKITSGSSDTGTGTVYYTVTTNTATTSRSGTMKIAGQTFTVTQLGTSSGVCTYKLSATNVTLRARGGTETVRVKVKGTGCSWTAMSNADFITIIAGASGSGDGTVRFSVPVNTNATPLTGTMTIAGQTFTVDQVAAPCEFSLSETTASFSSTGGSNSVAVTANGTNCTWRAVVSGTFIQITSDTSGTGSGTVDYTVEANVKTTTRKGTITVGKEKLTITQSGAP